MAELDLIGVAQVSARRYDWRPPMARAPLIVVALVCLAAGRATQPDRVVIPAGVFTQGSTRGEEDERPARKVTLKAFAIDRTERRRHALRRCARDDPLPTRARS